MYQSQTMAWLASTVKSGTGGVPFAFIQYNAIPQESPA